MTMGGGMEEVEPLAMAAAETILEHGGTWILESGGWQAVSEMGLGEQVGPDHGPHVTILEILGTMYHLC